MTRVVAVSPHLDDAVWSAGGTLAVLAAEGAVVEVVTACTASIPAPTGFALACQLDKGLGADVDYLALRRGEDEAACAAIGAQPVWLGLHEAPGRGYGSAPALFGPVRDDDDLTSLVAARLAPSLAGADLVLGPQALGSHVDHRLVRSALTATVPAVAWYRDTPYAMRDVATAAPVGEVHVVVRLDEVALAAKVDAALRYASQVGFQFGGADDAARALRAFASAEGRRYGVDGPAEVLRCTAAVAGRLAELLPSAAAT